MNTTIIGGSLGAGKTTLLENLLKNGTFEEGKTGVVVMDAAGQVDYDRLRTIAEDKGVRTVNATAACAVCGGPSTATRETTELRNQGVENVVIELSGRVAIPSMQNKLLESQNPGKIQTTYLLDPETMGLVGAAGELPFAQVVGITKNPADESVIREYTPQANILLIAKDYSGTLEDLFRGAPKELFEEEFHRPHSHNHNPDLTTQFFASIENPYPGFEQLAETLTGLGVYRAKGHLALDNKKLVTYNLTNGTLEQETRDDQLASNGVIMLASPLENRFSRKEMEQRLAEFIEKPDVPPVMRIYSPQEQVKEYIGRALEAGNYDEALGAAEQFQFERQQDGLVRQIMPEFVQGKQAQIDEAEDMMTKALQGMALIYALHTHKALTTELEDERRRASREYLDSIDSLTTSDWQRIKSDDVETAKYIPIIAQWAQQYQR